MSSLVAQYTHSRPYSSSNSSTLAHHSSKHHKSKYKTKTKTVTEDCDDDDNDESITTSVEVSSTPVTITAPGTVTKTVIRIDFESTKSLHKPKHTKHHLTETEVETETETMESTSPTVTESSETHTKHHKSKSKHTKSKHHKSKHHTKHSSSETVVETPVPTSVQSSSLSQSASDTSKEEVVVITTEEVEVITTGVEEVVSTITLSEGDTRLSTLTKASSTESSIVAPWRTSTASPSIIPPRYWPTPDWPYRIWSTETHSHPPASGTHSRSSPIETLSPFLPMTSEILSTSDWWESHTWWFSSTKTESPAEDTTPPTRSGHKTKDFPFSFSMNPPSSVIHTETNPISSISSDEIPPPWTTSWEPFQPSFPPKMSYTTNVPVHTDITTAPEFPPPAATWSADSLVGILNARDSAGDPQKKHDKMYKPDKAMSKRMSRWSKHHSRLLEKSWSARTKYEVKSLEQQMRYDKKNSRKHHTTLAAVLPAMASPIAEADADADADAAIIARNADAADKGDPEKDYQFKMSIANKVYNKFSSFAEQRYQKQESQEQKKASKKRAKSIAKQEKKAEKSRKKAIKSRMKHHKGGDDVEEEEEVDYGDEDVVVWADAGGEMMVSTTPKTGVPAMATVTATVTTVVGGGAGNGTLSTSWRVQNATQTASASTAGW